RNPCADSAQEAVHRFLHHHGARRLFAVVDAGNARAAQTCPEHDQLREGQPDSSHHAEHGGASLEELTTCRADHRSTPNGTSGESGAERVQTLTACDNQRRAEERGEGSPFSPSYSARLRPLAAWPVARIGKVPSDCSTEQAIDLRQELGKVEPGRTS